MAEVSTDRYGFFNGIYGLEQSNWANYWTGIIPSGVIAGLDDELEVYAQADGMKVYVKTGQAMIDAHRAWSSSVKTVTLSAADSSFDRIDLIVMRVIYGNEGQSTVVLDVKTGTPAADPAEPALTQVTGTTFEIPLAGVYVAANVVTIAATAVRDRRYLFKLPSDTVETFSSTTLTPENDREYRNGTELNALTINLPEDPHPTFMTSVNFTSSASFSGVTVNKGSTTISGTSDLKVKGDTLNLVSKRYNIVFYWDGSYYWAASAAV